jgi:nitrate/nitrite-specific signal transduction histidine kinase
MRDRAKQLNGRFEIEPTASGTRVLLTLPRQLPAQDGAESEGHDAAR